MACTDTAALNSYTQAMRAWLSFPSPWLLALFALISAIARTQLAPIVWRDGVLFLAGIALWPWIEWTLHRYVLHMKPIRWGSRTWDLAWSQKHRAHHRSPTDPRLILLPPVLHLVAGSLLFVLAFVSPQPALALSMVCGVALAALNYEWTHFLVHTRVRPRLHYYQSLFRAHRLHHFRNENYWYGFTLTSVDRCLGTGPHADAVERSEHCHDLGISS
nr:sterol desaturase family protein [Oceanococcus sp. HetDA_MAG_MS8]